MLGWVEARHNLPHSKLNEELALLLRAPGTRTEDVLEGHLTVNAEAVCDGAHTVGTESASVM